MTSLQRLPYLLTALGLSLTLSFPSGAVVLPQKYKAQANNIPAVLQADDVSYDETTDIVTATGNVFVSQGSRLLSADQIQYFKSEDRIVASGNVWLKEEGGNYSFATYAELKNKMNDGFVNDLKVLLVDNSRAAGKKAKRIDGEKTIIWQGVYSPCNVCKANPDSLMLWQLKSDKIIHDAVAKEITYHHVWMEFLGIPIFYSPYFFHPDPTVKRKSGLLTPIYMSSKDLGVALTLPYYWAISENKDLTLFPTLSTKVVGALAAKFRHRLRDGAYAIEGSFLSSENNNSTVNNPSNYNIPGNKRWHLFLNGRYEFDDSHLLTLDIRRASDLTYLRRFSFLHMHDLDVIQGTLTSTAAFEQFKDTSYGVIRGYVFQSDTNRTTPFVLPIADYNYESLPGRYGETWQFDANFLHLNRKTEIVGRAPENLVRGSLAAGGQIPYVSNWGDIWQLKFKLRGDVYAFRNYKEVAGGTNQNGNEQRLFPQASFSWHYPFIRYFSKSSWMIEPAAMVVASSQGGNSLEIPNEDSPAVTLDQTSLFLNNRFYGLDRVDSGYRLVYGIHNRYFFGKGRRLTLFFGQSCRLDHKQVLPDLSREDRNASSFVVSSQLVPNRWLDLRSRMLLARESLRIERSESTANLNLPFGSISTTHNYFNKKLSLTNQSISQISWAATTPEIYKFVLGYSESRNLVRPTKGIRLLTRTISGKYHNECLITTVSICRTGFRDRDLRPDTRLMLQFDFKNLGTFSPLNAIGLSNQINRRLSSQTTTP